MRKRVFVGWMEKEPGKPGWTSGCNWARLQLWLWKKKGMKEEYRGWPPVKVKVTIEEVEK